jgi:protein-S-isoprenylcysteine O-methyltransferase Ste14
VRAGGVPHPVPRSASLDWRPVRDWIVYTLARLGVFAVVFLTLVWFLPYWVAAIFAALIALCVSYLALGRLRERVTVSLASRRTRSDRADEAAEDAALEGDRGAERE